MLALFVWIDLIGTAMIWLFEVGTRAIWNGERSRKRSVRKTQEELFGVRTGLWSDLVQGFGLGEKRKLRRKQWPDVEEKRRFVKAARRTEPKLSTKTNEKSSQKDNWSTLGLANTYNFIHFHKSRSSSADDFRQNFGDSALC